MSSRLIRNELPLNSDFPEHGPRLFADSFANPLLNDDRQRQLSLLAIVWTLNLRLTDLHETLRMQRGRLTHLHHREFSICPAALRFQKIQQSAGVQCSQPSAKRARRIVFKTYEASGKFPQNHLVDFIIYLKSGNQTLAVYVDDEWLKSQNETLTLAVDGKDYAISAGTPGKESLLVTVSLGEHAFSVRHGDTVVHHPKMFEIEKDGRRVLQITATDISLLNSVPQELAGRKADDSPASGMAATNRSTQTDAGQAGSAAPWITLFDGSDVGGWSSLGPFKVEQGLLIANDGRANAVSKGQFSDFELEAEWKIDSHANGGIYYRDQPFEGVRAGNEYQIIDGSHPGIKELSHRSGALYGVFPGNIAAERSPGEWNKTRIVCRGSQVEHWLNDQKVLAYDISSPEFAAAIHSSKITTGKEHIGSASRGHILLQSQTGEIAFRSIRIRELNSSVLNVTKNTKASQLSIFTSDRFSVINNATVDEVLTWSRALPKDFIPSWSSLRGNSPVPIFDARAVYLTGIKGWKLEVVDADKESFEQPQLKGYMPANIVTFQDQGKIRSLCLVLDAKRAWSFWSGSTPLVQQKISDAQSAKAIRNGHGRQSFRVPCK